MGEWGFAAGVVMGFVFALLGVAAGLSLAEKAARKEGGR